MNEVVRRKVDPDALFTGLVLVAAGVAFLTGDFGHIVRNWWPMLFVLVGIPKLFQRRTVWAGFFLISVGAWLQLARLHWYGMSYRSSWPLLLILVGAGIALRAIFDVAEGKRDES
jgi:hypothetical protein